MFRSRLPVAIVATWLWVVAAQAITVDEIVARHVESRGGREAFEGLGSLRLEGTLSLEDLKGPYSLEWKRPDKLRVAYEFHGNTALQLFDGKHAFAVSHAAGAVDVQPIEGEQFKRIQNIADYVEGALIDHRAKGHELKLLGEVELDGAPAYRIEVRHANGQRSVLYLETEHCLVIQRESTLGEVELRTRLSNYKPVGAVLLPHRIDVNLSGGNQSAHGGRRQLVEIDSAKVGLELGDDRFAKPAVGSGHGGHG